MKGPAVKISLYCVVTILALQFGSILSMEYYERKHQQYRHYDYRYHYTTKPIAPKNHTPIVPSANQSSNHTTNHSPYKK